MKLRNKKTGEIADLEHEGLVKSNPRGKLVVWKFNANDFVEYDSLAELNEEWEDAPEEPKGIKSVGNIGSSVHIELGSKEEAEKAVEKLKAWKRLKDKGFEFCEYDDGYKHDFNSGHIEFYVENDGGVLKDLDLLFGGEND